MERRAVLLAMDAAENHWPHAAAALMRGMPTEPGGKWGEETEGGGQDGGEGRGCSCAEAECGFADIAGSA